MLDRHAQFGRLRGPRATMVVDVDDTIAVQEGGGLQALLIVVEAADLRRRYPARASLQDAVWRRIRPRRLGKRPLGPGDGARIVAGTKGQAADLLVELGALDGIARFAQPVDAGVEAGLGALAVARFPMQRPRTKTWVCNSKSPSRASLCT